MYSVAKRLMGSSAQQNSGYVDPNLGKAWEMYDSVEGYEYAVSSTDGTKILAITHEIVTSQYNWYGYNEVGKARHIYVSTNSGATFTYVSGMDTAVAIASNGTTFVVALSNATFMRSTDLTSWTSASATGSNRPGLESNSLRGYYLNGKFIFTALNGSVYYSTDAITWPYYILQPTFSGVGVIDSIIGVDGGGYMFSATYDGAKYVSSVSSSFTNLKVINADCVGVAGGVTSLSGSPTVYVGLYTFGAFHGTRSASTIAGLKTAPLNSVNTAADSIAFSSTAKVFVTAGFNILHSGVDGSTWTQRAPPIADIRTVEIINNVFFLFGVSTVQTSTDGITWTSRLTSLASQPYTVAHNGTTYVVVLRNGNMKTSTDLITWTDIANPNLGGGTHYVSGQGWNVPNNPPFDLIWASNFSSPVWIAACDGGVYTTDDLATWSLRYSSSGSMGPNSTFSNNVLGISGSNIWCLRTNSPTNIASTPDGFNWSSVSLYTGTDLSQVIRDVPECLSIVSGRGITGRQGFLITTAGVSASSPASSIAYTDGKIHRVIVGTDIYDPGYKQYIFTGSDTGYEYSNNSFSASTYVSSPTLREIVNNTANIYILVNTSNGIYSATDPAGPWTYRANGRDVQYSASTFAAVDNYSIVTSSTNGTSWTINSTITDTKHCTIHCLRYFGSKWVALGGCLLSMSKPVLNTGSWTLHYAYPPVLAVARNETVLVAVGSMGLIRTSIVGSQDWTDRTSGTTADLNDVAWDSVRNLFIVSGDTGKILTSPDGISWTIRSTPVADTLLQIAVSPDAIVVTYITSGHDLYCLASPDANVWTSYLIHNSTDWTNEVTPETSVVYNGTEFLAVSGHEGGYRLGEWSGTSNGVTWTNTSPQPTSNTSWLATNGAGLVFGCFSPDRITYAGNSVVDMRINPYYTPSTYVQEGFNFTSTKKTNAGAADGTGSYRISIIPDVGDCILTDVYGSARSIFALTAQGVSVNYGTWTLPAMHKRVWMQYIQLQSPEVDPSV